MTDAQRRLLTQMVEREADGWVLGNWIWWAWVRGPTRKPAQGTEVNWNTVHALMRREWIELAGGGILVGDPTRYRTTEAGREALDE